MYVCTACIAEVKLVFVKLSTWEKIELFLLLNCLHCLLNFVHNADPDLQVTRVSPVVDLIKTNQHPN